MVKLLNMRMTLSIVIFFKMYENRGNYNMLIAMMLQSPNSEMQRLNKAWNGSHFWQKCEGSLYIL